MLPRVPAGRRAATELAEAWCRTTSWEKKRRRAEVGPADRNGEQQRVRGGSRSADSCAKALIWDGEREREIPGRCIGQLMRGFSYMSKSV